MMYVIIRRLQKHLLTPRVKHLRQALQAEQESLETELHGVRMTVLYSDRQILVLETQE